MAAVMTVVAAAALLAVACSDSPSSTRTGGAPTSGGAPNIPSWVAYSQCVRSHGVPNFPDPDSSGQLSKDLAIRALREVSDSRARAATYACANLNPEEHGSPPLTAQQQQDYLRAAACMRAHGITNFPDPTFSGGSAHLPVIPASIDTSSQQFLRARQTCERLIPAGLRNGPSGG
jgi:hypothetical protein